MSAAPDRFAVAGAAQALAEDDGLAVRVDIYEGGREVRIGGAGRGEERERHRPRHLDRRCERLRRVDEYVVASLYRPRSHGPLSSRNKIGPPTVGTGSAGS